MTFNYTPLTENNKIRDMYPKVNDIGNFLKTEVNLSDIKSISGVDFNNILSSIPDSGNYYVTNSKNQPPGENWNGFVRLDKRNTSYYKIYYSPFNSNKIYIKTYANGTVYDWSQFKLDEGNFYLSGNTVDIKALKESITQHVSLVNPPKNNLNVGWLDFKLSKDNTFGVAEFLPDNTDSVFMLKYNNGTWSEWIERVPKDVIKGAIPVDIDSSNYYKYVWWQSQVGNKSLTDLIKGVPQGYHTFYAQGGIPGTPKGRSVRGTIQVDNDAGDITKDQKFISVIFSDYVGNTFSLYYGGNNVGWKPLKQQRTSVTLWEGTIDFATPSTYPMNDSVYNYDLLEVTYYTKSAGHYKTVLIDMKNQQSNANIVLRDFNLINNSATSNVEFFEGNAFFTDGKTLQVEFSKGVYLNGSTNTTSVSNWNQQGYIILQNIAGINTL
ncbi:virion structural protein [Staphylococcus phage CF5]|uniref:Virion structural protein n=1 Tax=Staphylococcus phage CF5 TaxID=3113739 RepID=A0AAX4J7D5_9CAUD|nr:virion structural protein [Staphylococcus phage CF5]